jgi:acid phosphatase (class A)
VARALGRAALVALAAVTCAGTEGYLPAQELPDGVALLAPPPAAGSPGLARDERLAAATQALRGTPRWALAASDADLAWPRAAGTFSCALGAPVSEAETPHLVLLLRRTQQDASRATRAAKARWARPRPFAVNGQPICVPGDRTSLARDGSYPSGHATAGWTWARVLGELAPERAEALQARGRAFGESRVVCNVHWYSDLVAGRALAEELVARLQRSPAFRADLAAARAELLAVRARGLAPTRDCAREAAALSAPLPVPALVPTP